MNLDSDSKMASDHLDQSAQIQRALVSHMRIAVEQLLESLLPLSVSTVCDGSKPSCTAEVACGATSPSRVIPADVHPTKG